MNTSSAKPAPLTHPAWMSLLLMTGTAALFLPVAWHEFVNYDTPLYITDNPMVRDGLSWRGVVWAFTEYHSSHWHPLTLVSHMLDCSLFGLNAGAHHLTSVLFHAANSALVFLLLRRLTNEHWPSVIVAALFAAHPLHVESVAWIAERQDVLSGFFGLLALIAYTRHGQGDGRKWLAAATALLALGLMSKAMLVTWPCVMLLLDFWPLNRVFPGGLQSEAARKIQWRPLMRRLVGLVMEKLPLFALSAAACWLAVRAEGSGEALSSLDALPLAPRIANAMVAYGAYLKMMVWPVGLAIHYQHPGAWPVWLVALSSITLLGITATALRFWRRAPFAITGWLWYVGTLAPVIGLVQIGPQAYADRYFYITCIGLFIAIVWTANSIAMRWPGRKLRKPLIIAAALGVAACCVATTLQLRHWRNSETLFLHALRVSRDNDVAHNNLGVYFRERGDLQKAFEHYSAASSRTRDYKAHFNLANLLCDLGRDEEAVPLYEKAIAANPSYDRAQNNLGRALERLGNADDAISHFQSAIRLNPDHPGAHLNLANLRLRQNRLEEAAAAFANVIRLDPQNARAHAMLGAAQAAMGNSPAAIASFRESLKIAPRQADVRAELGSALAAAGRIKEARTELEAALRMAESRADWQAAIRRALGNLPRE